jgi:hypothetical protein
MWSACSLWLVLLSDLLACNLSSVAATVLWMQLSSPQLEGLFDDVRVEEGHSLVEHTSIWAENEG